MENKRAITVIPTKAVRFSVMPSGTQEKRKVAAYARVSTDTEEQLSSYEAQVDYYTDYIKKREDWEFIKVYTDEGISATSTKKRDGFNQMIADAMTGKIDLIVTKSVSRFARNTVDTLVTIRKLKDKGIEVFFEKENIYTMDSKGELLITIMSSMAQEESRSISENVTWGQRKRFADGKVSIPYRHFLGYEKGDNGLPKIVESQAKTVRLIYKLFLEGRTSSGIARYLTASGITTPSGMKIWQPSTILSILSNEKYKGDALLQKKITVDFLTKKQKINEGEVPQYYVTNSHPAIISPDVFQMVQYEIKRRKETGGYTSGTNCFSSKIICGTCGSFYGPKVWHSTSKYRKVIWQCNHKFKSSEKCKTPHFDEEALKMLFLDAINQMITNKQEILGNCEMLLNVLTDTTELDSEIQDQKSEIATATDLIQQCVSENANTTFNQDEYQKRYNELVSRYEKVKNKLIKLEELHYDRIMKRDHIKTYISALEQQDVLLTEFDEQICYTLVDCMTVNSADEIKFTFKDGTGIKVK